MENLYWDPIGTHITKDSFQLHTEKLLEQVEKYRRNPHALARNRILFFCLGVGVSLFCVIFFHFGQGTIVLSIFSFAPLIIYLSIVHGLQQNLILFLLCQEHGWVYNPDEDGERFKELMMAYPEVFQVGHSQEIEDQIWGSFGTNMSVPFWFSAFTYTTGSGKHKTTHHHTLLAFKLQKKLPLAFSLYKKFPLSFIPSDYKTESEEFNRLFRIKVHPPQPVNKVLLLSLLSPSIQVRLINFAEKFPLAQVAFYHDCMILDFRSELWHSRYTDFFREATVDPRDTTTFISVIQDASAIPLEMLSFID